mmetsp:Transcript_12480/g.37109  ORF Transcript_12480/g.37109 Transcript_12480/m.37109 type:complete len:261 (-) Transcript_12480:13-795(-)
MRASSLCTMAALARSAAALEWHWLASTSSTMDAARELRAKQYTERGSCSEVLAVATDRQTSGRGTHGRKWIDPTGNAAVTVAVARDAVPIAPLTLVPLRVGVEIARVLDGFLVDSRCRVTLKWPNDVLLDGAKVAGILVESDGDDLLIGVGVNVAMAPAVPETGPDRGRKATSLRDCGSDANAEAVARGVAEALSSWYVQEDSAAKLITAWSGRVDWAAPLKIRDTGEEVKPLRLLSDGRLVVRPADGGPERNLVAEYLF